ncbi:polyprenyl synthetase family protein [Streptococcus sp. CSL10205-OR2]|uniref:polyprenyl synthetase family protein n=1 Tax=Streptococcus sp. CSL10205-OR2 TaxID=2980558 RepID=UPI0021D9CB81|nr:farnesyl diphosphate synthase [Streptococcus sp. CSL10205-OR2]MCU9534276.1 polyprenyl synthetase family protein [Streptococcus sp. CSL10205-OR2]
MIELTNEAIRTYYKELIVSSDLTKAILYSVDAGGKRLRPLLFLMLLEGFGITLKDDHYRIAASLEMIHTGSLIHDDLPAMDNDDYRRGQLTNHKKFDEATAILAGDALFLDAFGLLASSKLAPDKVVQLISLLSDASGSRGMVGGQMLDIKGEHQALKEADLVAIHTNKTGKLLTFPFIAAGIVSDLDEKGMTLLQKAGQLVGLAFQVRDDILDVTADFSELGKTPKKDIFAEKTTYPSLFGLEKSTSILNQSLDDALAIFESFEKAYQFDRQAIKTIIERLRLHA